MAAAAAAVLLVAALIRRRDWAALRYAALVLCFGLWSLARGAVRLELPWGDWLQGASLALGGPAALAFAAGLVPPMRALRAAQPMIALGTLALLTAVIATGNAHSAVHAATIAWGAVGVLAAAALLWVARPETTPRPSPDLQRLGYLAVGHALLGVAVAIDVVLWKLGAPPVASFFAGLIYLYVGYLHLARIRVADLRQLLGNALALAVMAAGLAGMFAALWLWVGPRLDLFAFDAFIASFVLLLFHRPLRDRLQATIERRLVAGKVELERTLVPLGERLPQILTLDELLPELLATLEQTDRVTASAVFLREDPQVGFRPVASIGLPPRPRVNLIRDPVLVAALETGDPLLSEELDKALAENRVGRSDRERERLERLRRMLRDLDAQLVLALRAGAHLVGFWTLTNASSREPFSGTEVQLLRGIADQAAISIENSKTFERIRARDRLVALGEMAGGLAHELRNPLATIRGALAVMTGGNGDRAALPDCDGEAADDDGLERVVKEEVDRLDRVLTLFLDYARPSVRRRQIDDPGAFIRSCVQAVARRHPHDRVALTLDIPAELPSLTADADQLETVVENAAQNAYDALEGGGHLHVRVRTRDDGADLVPASSGRSDAAPVVSVLEISLEDDGPGMDEATLERAFVPFFTTRDRGTGLGLPLCERLIRAQGGSISLHSKPGEGTRVTLRLPVDATAPEAER